MRLRSPSYEVARDCMTRLSPVSRVSESGRFGSCRASPSMPSAQRALRTERQARRAAAFRSGAILVDRAWTFWTMALWDDEAAMRRYILAGAHRQAMPKLVRGCDEASVVHWTRPGAAPPSWAATDQRRRADGLPSKVRHPSPQHATLDDRPPRPTRSGPITLRASNGGPRSLPGGRRNRLLRIGRCFGAHPRRRSRRITSAAAIAPSAARTSGAAASRPCAVCVFRRRGVDRPAGRTGRSF